MSSIMVASEVTTTSDAIPAGILPYYFNGTVVNGFGRGGKQLGCPTANLDEAAVEKLPANMPCGVFYGLARINNQVYEMVMSIGWNPHFKNEKKTIEVHLLHQFAKDFYGTKIDGLIIGFIRSMRAFNGLDELIQAIQDDISCAKNELKKLNQSELIDKYFPVNSRL